MQEDMKAALQRRIVEEEEETLCLNGSWPCLGSIWKDSCQSATMWLIEPSTNLTFPEIFLIYVFFIFVYKQQKAFHTCPSALLFWSVHTRLSQPKRPSCCSKWHCRCWSNLFAWRQQLRCALLGRNAPAFACRLRQRCKNGQDEGYFALAKDASWKSVSLDGHVEATVSLTRRRGGHLIIDINPEFNQPNVFYFCIAITTALSNAPFWLVRSFWSIFHNSGLECRVYIIALFSNMSYC